MSIPMNTICIECFLFKRLALARSLGTDEQATQAGKMMMRQYLEAPADVDSAWLGGVVDEKLYQFYGIDPDRLKAEKEQSNRFVLDRLPQICSRVESASDPVYAALQFAVLGNYLDFSALHGQVSFDMLEEMLDKALEMALDKSCYQEFLGDLARGKNLLYITDNAGEIVFDRLLAQVIQKAYPHLEITFCVRGRPVSNDATREDARVAGIEFPVIDNGTAIGGTVLSLISQDARKAMDDADVILAKGMGNTESLYGCGYNVYYAFLVKCARFIQFFNKPKMTPMFLRDRQ